MGFCDRSHHGLLWFLAASFLALASPALCQTAAVTPNAVPQFFNASGQPLAGGSVYFYVPNTTTCKTVWSDSLQVNAYPCPITLDAGGFPQNGGSPNTGIYGQGNYTETVYDANNNQIWSAQVSAYNFGVTGPNTSVVGDLACWNNTIGTLLSDCNIASANIPRLSANNTWTGTNTFDTTVTINPPTNSVINALDINQTGPLASAPSASFNYNSIQVTDTTNNTSGAAGVNSALFLSVTAGGANTAGSIWAGRDDVLASNAGTVNSGDMIGRVSRCVMSASFSSGVGGCYGANFQGILLSGGAVNSTNGEVAGLEADSRIDSGASAAWHIGVGAVDTGTGHGTLLDAAYEIGGAAGSWANALLLNSGHGEPALESSGCVICTDGTSETIATGMDLSAYSISGNFLKGPGGDFVVTGAGAVTAASINFGGSTLSTYAAGTWTPVLAGSTTAGTPTYSVQFGSYEHIGRLVRASFNVEITAWGGSPAGQVEITGLPFTSGNTTNDNASCYFGIISGVTLSSGYTFLSAILPVNSSIVQLWQGGSGETFASLPVSDFSASAGIIEGVCVYHT